MELPRELLSTTVADAPFESTKASTVYQRRPSVGCAAKIPAGREDRSPSSEAAIPTKTAAETSAAADELARQLATLPDPLRLIANVLTNAAIACSIFKSDGTLIAGSPAARALFGTRAPIGYNVFNDQVAIDNGIADGVRSALRGQTVVVPAFWYGSLSRKYSGATEPPHPSANQNRRIAISATICPMSMATSGAASEIHYVAVVYRSEAETSRERQRLPEGGEQREHDIVSRTAELTEANEELEAFSYSVSHDLRAPLRSIDGFAEMLQRDPQSQLGAEAQESLRRIRNATTRMNGLINDLLAFSRLGKQSLVLQPVDPVDLIAEVLRELEPKLRERAIDIRVGKLPPCQADPALLREVFLNLIDNAIKFTGTTAHAKIEIGAHRQDSRWVWFVSDNGVGFDMAQYSRLFGVFSRLHSADEFEGTGVGLALVNRIIKRHGGRIWAHSAPGQGATFSFTLGN